MESLLPAAQSVGSYCLGTICRLILIAVQPVLAETLYLALCNLLG